MAPSRSGIRMSAEERRAQIVAIAAGAFAEGGLQGTSTEKIAELAGISQPYLFRLFPTKIDLYLAVIERCFDRVRATFDVAAGERSGAEALEAMGDAYAALLEDRTLLRLELQAFASAAEGGLVQEHVRSHFCGLISFVRERTGVDEAVLDQFFAMGMLCNVIAALLPTLRIASEAEMAKGMLRILERERR